MRPERALGAMKITSIGHGKAWGSRGPSNLWAHVSGIRAANGRLGISVGVSALLLPEPTSCQHPCDYYSCCAPVCPVRPPELKAAFRNMDAISRRDKRLMRWTGPTLGFRTPNVHRNARPPSQSWHLLHPNARTWGSPAQTLAPCSIPGDFLPSGLQRPDSSPSGSLRGWFGDGMCNALD